MELVKKVIVQTGEKVHPKEGRQALKKLEEALKEAEQNGEEIYLVADLTLVPDEFKSVKL